MLGATVDNLVQSSLRSDTLSEVIYSVCVYSVGVISTHLGTPVRPDQATNSAVRCMMTWKRNFALQWLLLYRALLHKYHFYSTKVLRIGWYSQVCHWHEDIKSIAIRACMWPQSRAYDSAAHVSIKTVPQRRRRLLAPEKFRKHAVFVER